MNARTVLLAVGLVGVALLLSVGGIIALAVTGNPVPDVLQNVAVGSITGLLGLLATPTAPATPPAQQPEQLP